MHAQTISLAFKQGEQFKYALHFTGTFSAQIGSVTQDVKLDARATETVTISAVESDGTADMTLTLSDLTITTTGKASDGSTTTSTTTQTNAIPPQQLKVAPDGRILSINGQSISSESPFGVLAGTYLVYAVLPDSAVKPGDTWSKSYDQAQPGGSSSVHVTSNSTYLRDESFHGVNAAVIETEERVRLHDEPFCAAVTTSQHAQRHARRPDSGGRSRLDAGIGGVRHDIVDRPRRASRPEELDEGDVQGHHRRVREPGDGDGHAVRRPGAGLGEDRLPDSIQHAHVGDRFVERDLRLGAVHHAVGERLDHQLIGVVRVLPGGERSL